MNPQIVTITSQGQLTIPQHMRKSLGITARTKAVIEINGGNLHVKPKKDFWSLAGSLKSDVTLSDKQLRATQKQFETSWAEK